MQTFIGFVVVALGVGMVLKTEWLIQNFGTNNWAEQHLGYNGGSRLFYKLIGTAGVLIGFMLITNLFGAFLAATIGKILVRP